MNRLRAAIITLLITFSTTVVANSQQRKDQTNKSGPIKSVTLDQTVLTLPCPRGVDCGGPEPSSTFIVNVKIKPFKPNKNVNYRYSVTAGKIIGNGTKVVWDLTGIAPGSYKISVQAVRKGNLLQGYKSGTVSILSGICICDCFGCPLIQINATRRTISAGDTVSVLASITGGSQDNPLTLNWTTSVGEIVSGQTTTAILIRIPEDTTSSKIVVTLTIGGLDRRCGCPNSQSETIDLKPAE